MISFMRIFRRICLPLVYAIFSHVKKKNKIVICSSESSQAYQNISSLYRILYNEDGVVNISDAVCGFKEEIRRVLIISEASVLVVDTSFRYVSQLPISLKTRVVYCGHGGGAYKKMGFAALQQNSSRMEKIRVKRINGKYSYILCSSEKIINFITENYKLPSSRILPFGIPRTDILYNMDVNATKEEFFKIYPECKDRKLVLYAPTFRTKNGSRVGSFFLEDDELPNDFFKEYCLLFRKHPSLKNISIPSRWIDVSSLRPEICLAVSDLLVSDYSSIIFDYSFFHRPVFLLAPDTEEYKRTQRELWFSPRELVGEMYCKSTKEFLQKLKDAQPCNLWERFMDACDGHSSERISRWLIQLAKEER